LEASVVGRRLEVGGETMDGDREDPKATAPRDGKINGRVMDESAFRRDRAGIFVGMVHS
jgi:hypothetical protein